MLRANYDANAPSYFDNFRQFVLAVLAAEHPRPMLRGNVAKEVRGQFGIRIPELAMKSLLRRTSRQGLTIPNGTDFISLAPEGLSSAPDLTSQIVSFRRRQDELVVTFRDFLSTKFPAHAEADREILASQLSEYIENHSVPLLNQRVRGRSVVDKPSSSFEYSVSAFIAHLAATDQTRFSYVEEAAKGAILATVLTLDGGDSRKPLSELHVVLDTPVLFNLLGYHGEELEAPSLELLAMASRQGARVSAFEHSIREMDGILESVERSIRSGRGSLSVRPSYLHFMDIGASASDIAMARASLEADVTGLGVIVESKPEYDRRHTLDEAKLEDLLQEKVGYRQDATRIYDVDSLSAVYRMRRGSSSSKLEATRAVLVTSNSKLVAAANTFERTRDSYSLAIRDDSLAGILWVRESAVDSGVPRQLLLASAYSGMRPSDALWARYLAEVDVLVGREAVTPEEAIILRSTSFSRDAVMEETLGDPTQVTSDSPLVVLERLRSERSAEVELELEELRAATRDARSSADTAAASWVEKDEEIERLENDRAADSVRLEQLTEEVTKKNEALAEARAEIASRQGQDELRDERLRNRSERNATIRVNVILIAFSGLLFVLAILAVVQLPP